MGLWHWLHWSCDYYITTTELCPTSSQADRKLLKLRGKGEGIKGKLIKEAIISTGCLNSFSILAFDWLKYIFEMHAPHMMWPCCYGYVLTTLYYR